MKIVLLAHNLRAAGGLAVGKNILSTLLELAPAHEYLIIVPAGCGYPDFGQKPNVQVLEIPPMSRLSQLIFDWWHLPRHIKTFRPDWIWALGNIGLRKPSARQSLLFHNSHRLYPMSHSGRSWLEECQKIPFRVMSHIAVASALKQTQHVYCQTETVRQRFSHVFDYPLEQLFLFPPTFSLPAEAETPAVFQVTSEHDTSFKLFFPSGCYPHKNHSILIAVFSQFADELKDVTCFLTVSPQGNALEKKLASDIVQKGLSKKIILMGTIPFEHMGYYYQKTDAVIFPSLLETVGLGQIEGMHYSRPILTADYDWAHEVCDEAALYFDPLDPQDIKEKILQLKNDIALQEHLATKGKERVQGFFKSWPEIIKNVLENEGVEYQR